MPSGITPRGKLPGDFASVDMFIGEYWCKRILPRGILAGG